MDRVMGVAMKATKLSTDQLIGLPDEARQSCTSAAITAADHGNIQR